MTEHTENAVQTPTCAVANYWQEVQEHTVTVNGNDGVSVGVSDNLSCGVAVGIVVGVSVGVGILTI